MPERIALSDEQRRVLLASENLPKSLSVGGQKYFPETPVDAGHKGVVWRVRDDVSRPRALKLCLYADYRDRSYLEEASHAAELEPYREFARLVDAGLVELSIGGRPKEKFVAFVEEWIDGFTLDRFVREKREEVSASFLFAYAKSLSNALNALRILNLKHDDLHAGNVMLRRPAAGELDPVWSVKVIDTGSLKQCDVQNNKPKDDHRHFVDHLLLIWNTLHLRRSLPVRDRRFLRSVEHTLRSMLDDDPSIALRDPSQIVQQFDHAYTRANSVWPEGADTQVSPFEFISAEHIADDRHLVEIFARSCPFLDKVDGPDPCLITGPRGCGKSTILRWLSVKAHLHKENPDIHHFRIAGFYVSCSSDLQNKVGWITTDAIARRFRREIVHYFNLLIAREVVQTFAMIAARTDRLTRWGFGETDEDALADFVTSELLPTSRARVQGVPRLVQVAEIIEGELFATHRELVKRRNLTSYTGEAFLGALTDLLSRRLEFCRQKRIAFLIDDFSAHRIPPPVQVVLNPIIWERRASHIFKLSSEKSGCVLTDALGATVDVSREMIEVDCGREYLALDDYRGVDRARTFAIELLDNRLKASGYAGTTESLIGRSEWPEGPLGRALANRPIGRITDQYHGIDCIASVCSGDVSTLLLVYRKIFDSGAVTQGSTTRIPKTKQHEAIVDVSRHLLQAIKHNVPYGAEMFAIVNSFGTLVRNILAEGRWHKKGSSTTPPQCPRIELDQREGDAVESLTGGQRELALELVRRAIFIEMQPGLSRHQNVTTLRWHLRRVFLPAFGAALAKNDAVKESMNWLKFLLVNPDEACGRVWKKWPKQSGGAQQRLLPM